MYYNNKYLKIFSKFLALFRILCAYICTVIKTIHKGMKKIGKDIEVDIEGAAAIMGIAKRTFMQKYSTKIPGNRVKKTKTF